MPVTRIRIRTKPGCGETVEIWLFVPTSTDARFEPNRGSPPWPRAEGQWDGARHLGATDCDEDGVTTLWDNNEVTTLTLGVGDQLRVGVPATLQANGQRASQLVEVVELEVL